MKRKIFSKLLMGAFLIASVSSFVSCKDYDDDINNLQKQIDAAALKADLTALQQTLAAQISEAKSAAAAAQAAAEKAQATANNAATKDALEAVKTLATAAGTDAAKAIADAANAQNTADVAKSAATAAQEAAAAAQNVANGASDKAATALADAAKALATAEAANATAKDASTAAKAAQDAAGEAKTTAGEAKATAENALAAAGNATTQAAEALKAAGEAAKAAEAAKYNDEAVKLLIAQAQASADAAAEDAKDAAEAAAAAVLASASATEDAAAAKEAASKIDEAIAKATEAINEATETKIKAAVAEAIKGANQNEGVKALATQLEQLGKAQADLATKEDLGKQVEELQGKIDAATVSAETIAEVAAAAGTIKDALNEFLTAITSVELFEYTYDGLDRYDNGDLKFYWAEEVADWKFGMDLNYKGTAVTVSNTQLTDHIYEFKKGRVNLSEDSVLIRVVPIKAELTADMIALVNTQGDTIKSDFIQVGTPHRLTEKLTRGTDIEVGGLWVVPFKVNTEEFTKEIAASKPNVDVKKGIFPYAANFNKAVTLSEDGKPKSKGIDDKVLFALAVKTHQGEAEADSRRLITEHDLTLQAIMATHAVDKFDATAETLNAKGDGYDVVGGVIDNLKNRFTSTEDGEYTLDVPEYNYAGTITGANGQKSYNYVDYPLGWNNAFAPADMVIGKNVENRKADNRQGGAFMKIDVDDEILIDFTKYHAAKPWERIKGFYVTLDAPFALESDATELQAWSTYEYTNSADEKTVAIYNVAGKPVALSGKMFDGEKGVIRFHVPEDVKPALAGEIIGFRVWAVNFDGTLVNPDGRAFYIEIKGGAAAPTVPTINAAKVTTETEVTVTSTGTFTTGWIEINPAVIDAIKACEATGFSSYTTYLQNPEVMAAANATWSQGTPYTYKASDKTWTKGNAAAAVETNGGLLHEKDSRYDAITIEFAKSNSGKAEDLLGGISKDAKYIRITSNYPAEDMLDGETYQKRIVLRKKVNNKYNAYADDTYVDFKLKKVVAPTIPNAFDVRAGMADGNKVYAFLWPGTFAAPFNADPYIATKSVVAYYQPADAFKLPMTLTGTEKYILRFNANDPFQAWGTAPVWKDNNYRGVGVDDAYQATFVYDNAADFNKNIMWSLAGDSVTRGQVPVFASLPEGYATMGADAQMQRQYTNVFTTGHQVDVEYYYNDALAKNRYSRVKVVDEQTTPVAAGAYNNKTLTSYIGVAQAPVAKAKAFKNYVFDYACWHEFANYNYNTLGKVFGWYSSKNTKSTDKIAPAIEYGKTAAGIPVPAGVAYYDADCTTPNLEYVIPAADFLKYVIYTNSKLQTINYGKAVSELIAATPIPGPTQQEYIGSGFTIASAKMVVGNSGAAAYDEGTNYMWDGATGTLKPRAATVTALNHDVVEYLKFTGVDFFGHGVAVYMPILIKKNI